MLRLITGLAGAGKTAYIYEEIRRAVEQRLGGRILIVPEQFSHEAERELCRTCGDTMSLYAEVLSFTGLARSVKTELGGQALPALDKGGKLLCMALAVNRIFDDIHAFRKTVRTPEMQSLLVSTVDAMKTSCVTYEMLKEAAEKCDGELRRKLGELAMISEVYQRVVSESHADPADALLVLASRLPDSMRINENTAVYIDGFTDFTQAELEVIRELLKKRVSVTVCITIDGMDGTSELFAIQRRSATQLRKMTEELGEEFVSESISVPEDVRCASAPLFLADNVFTYTEERRDPGSSVQLFRCGGIAEECALAAAKSLELMREHGCRRRDIAIAVRGFDAYAPMLETTFADYGIPLFTTRRTSLSVRPLPLLISCAYDIINGAWKSDDIISYMGTGLTGLSQEECDILSEYVFRWDMKTQDWHRKTSWNRHPDGYAKEYSDYDRSRLEQINRIREKLASPLLALEKSSKKAVHASGQVLALYTFLEDLEIPRRLGEKAEELMKAGRKADAEEYSQIWEITVSALEQANAILGEIPMEAGEFSSLFVRTLSTYDIGIIPASLDSVTAGDFDRMRRRNIKNLIILGASSDRLPAVPSQNRLFSDDELMQLEELSAPVGDSPEDEMWREYALMYNCLSLPSERLIISYSSVSEEGAELTPSIVIDRAGKLFGTEPQAFDPDRAEASSEAPALRLAEKTSGAYGKAARSWFEKNFPGRLESVSSAAAVERGSLSAASVSSLYGDNIKISASKAEKFFSCRYSFFTHYGLRVQPYKKTDFESSDYGTFTHYVLQKTAEDVRNTGGFHVVTDEQVEAFAKNHIEEYEKTQMNGFDENSERFIYLFRRYEQDVLRIVLDTARELRCSKFEPAAFEFNFSSFPAVDNMQLNGVADRIDKWENNGKSYIRIADYKSGGKKFDLSDIWYGLSMQLIMYMYALSSGGENTRKALGLESDSIVPAGVVYVPAFSKYVSSDSALDDAGADSEHTKQLKRNGIVLTEDGVPEAWEMNGGTEFIPLTYKKDGTPKDTKSCVSSEQFSLLYCHVRQRLRDMVDGLESGSIEANPIMNGSSPRPQCEFCDMKGSCGFVDGENGEKYNEAPKIEKDDIWHMMREEAEQNG